MNIYIYTYTHINMCILCHIYMYIHIYTYSNMCIYMHVYICMYIHICIYIYMYMWHVDDYYLRFMYIFICIVYKYVYRYICRYIHIYSYMYTYLYIYVYMCVCLCVCVISLYMCIYWAGYCPRGLGRAGEGVARRSWGWECLRFHVTVQCISGRWRSMSLALSHSLSLKLLFTHALTH